MNRLGWLLLACAVLFASHGERINDDEEQTNAFWHLSHGELRIDEFPDFIYRSGPDDHERYIRVATPGALQTLPVGSTLLNILALPVAAAIFAVEALFPLWLVFATVAVTATWRAIGLAWPWDGGVGRPTLRMLVFAGLLAVATLGFRATSPDQEFNYAYTALQLTNLACWGLAGFLLWQTLRPHMNEGARSVAVAAFLLGPMLFWGQGIKYHALTALLMMVLVWLRSRPRSLGNSALLGGAAGFLFWTHPGPGAIAVFAIALVELPRIVLRRKEWRQVLLQWTCLVLGFAVGLAPYFVENEMLTGNPFLPPRLEGEHVVLEVIADETPISGGDGGGAAGGAGGGTGGAGGAIGNPVPLAPVNPSTWGLLVGSLRALPRVFLRLIDWQGVGPLATNLFSILTFGTRVEGRPLGIFLASPWMLASIAGAFGVLSWRLRQSEARFALAILAVYAVFLTHASTTQGDGFDVRMWLPSLPAFAVLAALGLRPLLAPLESVMLPRIAFWSIASVVGAYGLLVALTSAGYDLGKTTQDHAQLFLSFVAAACVIAALLAWVRVLQGRKPREHGARVTAVAAIVPVLAWTIMYCWVVHATIPDFEGHEGGGMFVAGLDPFTAWLNDAVLPGSPLPIVWNADGSLHYHPDYGLCAEDPSPCPPDLRAPWGNETATSPTP